MEIHATPHPEWHAIRHGPGLVNGYASSITFEPCPYTLCHGRTAWMSTGLLELESQAFHVHWAAGVVVTAGLGLGVFAVAAAIKPQVERVVVIKRAPGAMAAVHAAAACANWLGRDKIMLLEADAFAPDLAPRVPAPPERDAR